MQQPIQGLKPEPNQGQDTRFSGQHFIHGQWCGEASGFQRFDPVANQPLPEWFANAGMAEVELAANAAAGAFVAYRRTSPRQRAEFLDAIAAEIQADRDEIVLTAQQESGLPSARLEGELARTCSQFKLFAGQLRQPLETVYVDLPQADRTPLPKPDIRLGSLPLGPVAVFGASNFPLAFSTAGGDTASALAAGCPVIIKGHPAHPGTSERVSLALARAIARCAMPDGVFNLLQSDRAEIAAALVRHDAIKAVGFTGSLRVGRLLADICAARPEPIPFYGELGSTNPQFLLPAILEAQAETLANSQVQSMMMGHGQFCTSPGLVILAPGEAQQGYLATLAQQLANQDAAAMLTPGIAAGFQREFAALLQRPGIELLAQGKAATAKHHTRPAALRISATAFLGRPELQQEVFGPYALVVCCASKDEMYAIAEALDGQLTATLHGLEAELLAEPELVDILSHRVGRLIFNQMPTGVEVCHAMNHGGPYPASTDVRSTSVGVRAMQRFLRPICYQNMPAPLCPPELTSDKSNVVSR
ncbi:aldehyde dehydrogenase (NADP(+)) [Shewanella salipaludis]|uniref:Aldehyde dehydrogenase (NADP(+)) n=1 Tax=Shewanella salipaludis TaxID=2723052 RepID=A0A972G7X6_9GAMM|nr:aldehyde dehydrogenase (NADP(+)) [Shewanella salipaludis]NMH66135.1 aldehyde dehydrogenase (NADP(+)) [Shewanella salipaludis]